MIKGQNQALIALLHLLNRWCSWAFALVRQRQFPTLVDNEVVIYHISFYCILLIALLKKLWNEIGYLTFRAQLRGMCHQRDTSAYLQVDLCEVGLSSLPVNLKLLIESGKQVGSHDSLNKPSLLVSHHPIWMPAEATPDHLSSAYSTAWNDFLTLTWLYCQGFQSAPKLTETTTDNIIKALEANLPLADCVCRRFWWKAYLGSLSRAEQRELLWGVAEAWRGEQGSSDRHLSSSRFTSSRCLRIQPTQPAVSRGRARVRVCVYMCLCVCAYLSRAQVCSAD